MCSTLTTGLTSCGTYGHIPTQEQREAIQPGKTTERAALELLGKPGKTERSDSNKLHQWSQIHAQTGLVKISQFQILVDHSWLVLKKNDHEGYIAKSGHLVNEMTNPESDYLVSFEILKPGISGRDCERLLGNPMTRELLLSGEIQRVWIEPVNNLYLVTHRKPRQHVATFDARDRLKEVHIHR